MKTPPFRLCLLAAALGAAFSSFSAAASDCFEFPATGAPSVRHALLLAIDDHAFPLRDNLALFITHPTIRSEPVIVPSTSPDAPDNVAVFIYGTVLHEGALFRLWYYSCYSASPAGEVDPGPICYAESRDGLHWIRPNLGQVLWHGNRNNNAIALGMHPEEGLEGGYIVREDDDPRPERRYKMVFYYYGFRPMKPEYSQRHIGMAVSPDGLHWKVLPGDVTHGRFAELSSLYKQGGLYIVSSHISGRGADDRPEGREGYGWVSSDFDHWLPETTPQFKTPEPRVGSGYGTHEDAGKGIGMYTQDHEGIGAVSYGNVVVGLWGMWRQRVPNWGEGGINADLGLVVSEDGLHFDEPVKGQPFITSAESAARPIPGKHIPTILTVGNGILNVGRETWIYHSRWLNVAFQHLGTGKNDGVDVAKDYWGGIGLATLPRDRWGGFGLSGTNDAGSLWTTPVTLPVGARLSLNASGAEGLRVSVTDARFNPLAGFGGGASAAQGDVLDGDVGWQAHSLAELAGQTVRFHIEFARGAGTGPRLFALNLGQ